MGVGGLVGRELLGTRGGVGWSGVRLCLGRERGGRLVGCVRGVLALARLVFARNSRVRGGRVQGYRVLGGAEGWVDGVQWREALLSWGSERNPVSGAAALLLDSCKPAADKERTQCGGVGGGLPVVSIQGGAPEGVPARSNGGWANCRSLFWSIENRRGGFSVLSLAMLPPRCHPANVVPCALCAVPRAALCCAGGPHRVPARTPGRGPPRHPVRRRGE